MCNMGKNVSKNKNSEAQLKFNVLIKNKSVCGLSTIAIYIYIYLFLSKRIEKIKIYQQNLEFGTSISEKMAINQLSQDHHWDVFCKQVLRINFIRKIWNN